MMHLFLSIYLVYLSVVLCGLTNLLLCHLQHHQNSLNSLKHCTSTPNSALIHAWFTRFLYMAPSSRYPHCSFDTKLLCCLEWGGEQKQPWILFLSSDNPLPSHGCQKLNLQDKGGESTADKLQHSPDRWMINKRQRLKPKGAPWKMKWDIQQDVHYL